MNQIWIVVANASRAFIYAMPEKPRHLILMTTLQHSESRLKNQDLVSDKPGHYQVDSSFGATRGSYAETTSHKLLEAKHFADEIATVLEKGRVNHNYHSLILIAEPHFQGLLNKQCSHQVQTLIKHSVPKDYTQYPEKKLETHLKKILEREIGALLIS